ncbi:MAG: hypothetical protein R3F30_06145 [Planctomycetota bacterium]
MRTTLAIAALAMLTTSLTAQHTATLPELYTGSHATGGNSLPFYRSRGFIQ